LELAAGAEVGWAAGAVTVSDAEWQWDRKKLTLYFTAEKRVDFRALVRDLAAAFRTRIELKQIGVRDEAKRLGGIGRTDDGNDRANTKRAGPS